MKNLLYAEYHGRSQPAPLLLKIFSVLVLFTNYNQRNNKLPELTANSSRNSIVKEARIGWTRTADLGNIRTSQ